ncbi:MAG: glycosyltransferase family 4 protein [Winogradskyella sp.]|uniref:glycosyltransferase family 4 protein n=1 Tax=Winogradskyella sp. TaxID=1883156 RepID=UPI0025F8084E|nr:glycosyltransferase family 1 protein [Winogradskyella sp.]NRB59419.1 glycosyltransferase family 4 protein [Winogradskyella sp.]
MKVAVWINSSVDPKLGGGFSYTSKLVQLIDDKQFNSKLEVCFIGSDAISFKLNKPYFSVDLTAKKLSIWHQFIVSFSRKFRVLKQLKKQIQLKNKKAFEARVHQQVKQNNIDIIYYLSPMQRHVPNFPFITTNWDLGHLTLPPFPEVTEPKELKARAKWYNNVLPNANCIFTESEAGKKELIDFLSIPEEKIKIVPIFPGNIIHLNVKEAEQGHILDEFGLERNNFYIYPAQFWKHKNHERLISAFDNVLKINPNVKLVLSGSDKGELNNVLDLVKLRQLEKKVLFTGFISNEALYTLYKNALALVFPTLLGPTNMPPLEARVIGCPVLCSDFMGHREQLRNGAIYFKPEDEKSIFESMIAVLDMQKRKTLLDNAYNELTSSSFNEEFAISKIERHLLSLISQL